MWIKKGQYYIKREQKAKRGFEEDYWGNPVDPDGKTRDLLSERKRKLLDCKNELDYIQRLNPGKILDVGCAYGHFLAGVDDRWDKYGQDISKYVADEAAKHCNMFCGELSEAKFESNFFDVIFTYHVVEHLSHPEDVIREIYRILKPNGKFIVGTPNFDSACARRFGDKYRMLHDDTHVSLFSDYSLKEMLEDFSFEIELIDYPFFETEHFNKENLGRLFDTTKVSPPFYGNIFTIYANKKVS